MCTDDTTEFSAQDPGEPADASPAPAAEPAPRPGWSRRTFLKAAALGTAAAALVNRTGEGPGGLSLGPAAASAAVTCRAGDIEVSGGQAINEPCTCTGGTFAPVFEFFVSNQNNANRTCITLILGTPAATNSSTCAVLNGTRLLLTVSDPNRPAAEQGNSFLSGFSSNVRMIGTPVDSSGNPVQISCGFTQCCFTDSIIAFKTQQNQSQVTCSAPLNIGDFASAQCRRVTICLTGFGITAQCADASCATRSLTNGCCAVPCGQSLSVKITAVGGSAPECSTPLAISVKRPGEASFTAVTLNSSGCYVDSSPVQGTYTFRATDCHGCFREATLAVCVSTIATPTLTAGTTDCSGSTTFTVAPCPPASGVTYTLQQVDCATGEPVASPTITNVSYDASTCTFTATLPQGQTTCVRAKASNGTAACDVFSNVVTVVVPAALSIGAPVQSDNPCNGVVTFAPGAVSGGAGPYNYAFALDGGAFASGATFAYHPTLVNGGLDTSCHSLVVRVTDANGCTATSPATTFSQCVSTTTGC